MHSLRKVLLCAGIHQALAIMIAPPMKSNLAKTSGYTDYASMEGSGPAACLSFKLPEYMSLHHGHHHSHHHLHHHVGDETQVELPDLVFIHIPKNAGTLIEDVGFEHRVEWGVFMNFTACDWDLQVPTHCSRWHVPPRFLATPNVYTEKNTFCVSRHPYERALSQFKWMNTPPCTQENLNTYLQSSMQKMLDGDEFEQDCHLIPQAEYIWDERGHQSCNNILRLENLAQDFNALMKRNGYDIELLSNRTDNTMSNCPELSIDDFNDDTLAMLNKVYKDDFKKLNYKPRFVRAS